MNEPRDWMTPTDILVLVALGSSNIITVYTPSILAYNLTKGRSSVNRRLGELHEHGYVDRVERGKYRLSEKGEAFLAGQL